VTLTVHEAPGASCGSGSGTQVSVNEKSGRVVPAIRERREKSSASAPVFVRVTGTGAEEPRLTVPKFSGDGG